MAGKQLRERLGSAYLSGVNQVDPSSAIQASAKGATDIGNVMAGSGDPSWLALYVCLLIIAVLALLLHLSMRSNRLMSAEYVEATRTSAETQIKAHQATTESLLVFSGRLIQGNDA